MNLSGFKKLVDPRRIAWVTWSFLANNTVSKTFYLGFCLVDLALIVFYSLILVSRIHYSNLAPLTHTPNGITLKSVEGISLVQQNLVGNLTYTNVSVDQ